MVNSKGKGGAFERKVCVELSLWISQQQRKDVFWRAAMSGGRATVRGQDVRQAGDVCAVAAEGHWFTDRYFIECKHVRDLAFTSFVLDDKGALAKFWRRAQAQAAQYARIPLLIAKQNRIPPLVLSWKGQLGSGVRCSTAAADIGLWHGWLRRPVEEIKALPPARKKP